eukprot:363700-Chlamydomonas_euryale.AAC.8
MPPVSARSSARAARLPLTPMPGMPPRPWCRRHARRGSRTSSLTQHTRKQCGGAGTAASASLQVNMPLTSVAWRVHAVVEFRQVISQHVADKHGLAHARAVAAPPCMAQLRHLAHVCCVQLLVPFPMLFPAACAFSNVLPSCLCLCQCFSAKHALTPWTAVNGVPMLQNGD